MSLSRLDVIKQRKHKHTLLISSTLLEHFDVNYMVFFYWVTFFGVFLVQFIDSAIYVSLWIATLNVL